MNVRGGAAATAGEAAEVRGPRQPTAALIQISPIRSESAPTSEAAAGCGVVESLKIISKQARQHLTEM